MTYAAPDAQIQCTFIARLPREVRDAVYLELWRSCGLRQHIVWHEDDDKTKSHFCRWRCTTPFQVEDELQEDIDVLRIQRGVPLGDSFEDRTNALRLYSPWKNHWACGERIAEVYGDDDEIEVSTSRVPCWSRGPQVTRSPYLSMLLSCKVISSECLTSIYESTTFVFTDTIALDMFLGFCKEPPPLKKWPKVGIPSLAFRTHGKHLELSLDAVFPMQFTCTSPIWTPIPEERHSSPDFHGLRFDLLQNLATLDIWVAARSTHLLLDEEARNLDQSPYNITQLSIESLREALSHFEMVDSVTLSIPLAQCAEPEDGYLDGDTQRSSLRIWRRGAGDRFHPALYPVTKKHHFDSSVYSSKDRVVKLAYNPEAITHVHYAYPMESSLGSQEQRPRHDGRRMARLVEVLRSKGKWLRRDR